LLAGKQGFASGMGRVARPRGSFAGVMLLQSIRAGVQAYGMAATASGCSPAR